LRIVRAIALSMSSFLKERLMLMKSPPQTNALAARLTAALLIAGGLALTTNYAHGAHRRGAASGNQSPERRTRKGGERRKLGLPAIEQKGGAMRLLFLCADHLFGFGPELCRL